MNKKEKKTEVMWINKKGTGIEKFMGIILYHVPMIQAIWAGKWSKKPSVIGKKKNSYMYNKTLDDIDRAIMKFFRAISPKLSKINLDKVFQVLGMMKSQEFANYRLAMIFGPHGNYYPSRTRGGGSL